MVNLVSLESYCQQQSNDTTYEHIRLKLHPQPKICQNYNRLPLPVAWALSLKFSTADTCQVMTDLVGSQNNLRL